MISTPVRFAFFWKGEIKGVERKEKGTFRFYVVTLLSDTAFLCQAKKIKTP